MSELPVGTVTFVFTDIEGSTLLLKRLGTDYAGLLARHRELVRDALEQNRGMGDGHPGRGVLPRFRPSEGRCRGCGRDSAYARRRGVEGADVRIQIGMHTGEPELSNDRSSGSASIAQLASARSVTVARCLPRARQQGWSMRRKTLESNFAISATPVRDPRSQRTHLPARGGWAASGLPTAYGR